MLNTQSDFKNGSSLIRGGLEVIKWGPVTVYVHSASPSHFGVIYVHRTLCQKFHLYAGSSVHLHFGGKTTKARVLYQTTNSHEMISFSPDIQHELGIPDRIRIQMYAEEEGHIRFGPLVGILARIYVRDGKPNGMQVAVFERLLEAAEKERLFGFIFSPEQIHWEKGVVQGWYRRVLGERKIWVQDKIPLPDVIYDQIISRQYEKNPRVIENKTKLLRMYQTNYFNPGFFDKWQVHTWLSKDPRMKGYLPHTILLESREKMIRFLQEHRLAYVKPIHGSLGIGIIKVVRLQDGRYSYHIKGKQGIVKEGIMTTPAQIMSLTGKSKKYVIQQGLNLLTIDNRPFDIRILMQKDQTGNWRRTKAFCRIAQRGDITSNLSTGGDALPISVVLRKICADKNERVRIQRKINQLSRMLPLVIEEQCGLTLGELGLDIGIDEDRYLWVIEVNAKPWKKPLTENGSQHLVVQSFRRPMLFAKYLLGFRT
jgi:glutathione synthase/RimK-type ligase-like ATP-grasp enzyme